VLVSNDDGINAPGLRALVTALVDADFSQLFVCAPSGERSAQSHAITLGRYLACTEQTIEGVQQAIGVDGTPADSVMLALNSPVLQVGGLVSGGRGAPPPAELAPARLCPNALRGVTLSLKPSFKRLSCSLVPVPPRRPRTSTWLCPASTAATTAACT
jgi:hypothetical protein